MNYRIDTLMILLHSYCCISLLCCVEKNTNEFLLCSTTDS